MAAVLRALQLDYDEIATAVQTEQVDASQAAVPLAEFFRDDERVRGDYVDLVTKDFLKILRLANPFLD